MDAEAEKILRDSEGRYPTSDETKKLLEVARDYERRVEVVRALEKKEADIVKYTVDQMFIKFPRFRDRPQAEEKTARDLGMTLKYIAQSILRNDKEFLGEKVLYWLKGIVSSKGFLDVYTTTYEILGQSVAKHLSKAQAEEVNKYVSFCIQSCKTTQPS